MKIRFDVFNITLAFVDMLPYTDDNLIYSW